MKKKVSIFLILSSLIITLVLVLSFGLPAFAQTYVATRIPGQPLSGIAAGQIINHSGLPAEILPDGTTSAITRGRDAVNAYRYAHSMLHKNGWYRGISEDHTPLLIAMVNALEKEEYTSSKATWEDRKTEILHNFSYESATQNARGLGFNSLEELNGEIRNLVDSGKLAEATLLSTSFDSKWK